MTARIAALAALALACVGVDQASGQEAAVRVPGARYVPGAFPPEGTGPRVSAVESPNNTVRPGQRGKVVSGRTGGAAFALAVGLDGDAGYWIFPAGDRSVLFPGELEFETTIDLATTLRPGRRALLLQAADGAGRYGPRASIELTVASAVPDAELVVALRWDADADLNLRVALPDGAELTPRGLRSADGRPVAVMPTVGPLVDVDSNGACRIDGRRVENALFRAPAPGRYVVRVEAWSLCGEASARWDVVVYRRGAVLAEAHGAAFDTPVPTTGRALEAVAFEIAP